MPERAPHRSTVFVCTHHTGAADFLAAYPAIAKIAPDLKVVMNRKLLELPPLARIGIGVHAISERKNNSGGRREIEAHLERGGNLLVFPAGKVAVMRSGEVSDQPWRTGVARTIRESAAWAVPVHVDARNSPVFYLLRELFPRLSMIFLLRVLKTQAGRDVRVRIGEPISARELGALGDVALLARLRKSAYRLAESERRSSNVFVPA